MAKTQQEADSRNYNAEMQQSTNLISRNALWSRLTRGVEARTRFVESHLSKNLAFQIRALRDREEWSQWELAGKTGMNQNAISRLESPSYGKPTITTLKRLAAIFDVALVVRFVPFSQLVDWVSSTPFQDGGLSTESLTPASFRQENQQLELGTIPYNVNVAAQVVTVHLGPLALKSKPTAPSAASELNRPAA
jgi:transcriptional regulator with XRE-family HTH domain